MGRNIGHYGTMAANHPRLLKPSFFARPTLTVARELLGQLLVHESKRGIIVGKIVETEGYLADDPACHAFKGPTPRCAVMFGPPGYSYVYFTYGMYHCFNVITEQKGVAGAVLVRAVEPVEGVKTIMKNFKAWPKNMNTSDPQRLASGPGKLCVAYGFDRSHNALPVSKGSPIRILEGPTVPPRDRVIATRIGITQNANAPYRFYIKAHPSVSKTGPAPARQFP